MTKRNLWTKEFIPVYNSEVMPHHWRKSGQEIKQGRNLDAGVEAETMEEHASGLFLTAC